MCQDIQWVKNVTTVVYLGSTNGSFTKQLTGLPDRVPDEVIVRALNFNGAANDSNLYVVWCNLNNDYIGSFCGGSLAPHFPQTRIFLNGQVPNCLQFQLFTPNAGGIVVPVTSVTGDLAIHLDFVYYKKA